MNRPDRREAFVLGHDERKYVSVAAEHGFLFLEDSSFGCRVSVRCLCTLHLVM